MEKLGLDNFMKTAVCRLCLTKISENDLNPAQTKAKLISSLIQDINYCLNIVVSKEFLCTRVCGRCSMYVRKFAKFKLLCSKANEKFQKLIIQCQNKEFSSSTVVIKLENVKQEQPSLFIKKETLDVISEAHDTLDAFSDNDTPVLDKKPIRKNKLNVKKTITKVANIEAVNCKECPARFSSESDLVRHTSEIHGQENNSYKCCGCEKRFKNKNNRRGHEVYFCESLKNGYYCPKCSTFLSNRREYEKHKYCHVNNIPVPVPEGARFQCGECEESYGIKARLIKHLQIHYCKKDFTCETCGRGFARKDYLDKHADIHTGVRSHQCPHCGYTSRQKGSLIVHIRKHTGERPYQCDICPQKCISSSNLIAHRRRHLGLKLFQCTICGKQFGYKQSLEEHVSIVHGQHKYLLCSVCGASYKRRRHLRRHLQTKHPDVCWRSAIKSNENGAENGGCDGFGGKSDVSK